MSPPRAAPRNRIVRITRASVARLRPGGRSIAGRQRTRGRSWGRSAYHSRFRLNHHGRQLAGRVTTGQRGSHGVAQVGDRHDPDPLDSWGAPPSFPHDGPGESEPRCLAQPAIEAGYRTQLAEETDLADRDRAAVDRPITHRGRERERDREVEPGLGDGQPAGEIGVDVMAPEADPGAPAEDRQEQREPRRVDARGAPSWGPAAPGADSALTPNH